MRQRGPALLVKKLVDRGVASAILLAASPILTGAVIAIATTMGRPVLFKQSRPGRNGRRLRIYKLRTMTNARDENGVLLSDDQRLTRLGRLLRATSIDDLPNLINVLKGELSLVGPRPLLESYLPLYSPEQARRHDVLPGITGWAQIHGRNALSHEDKFALDVWYVDHWTPWLDLEILLKTIVLVLRRAGVTDSGSATKELWRGNQPSTT